MLEGQQCETKLQVGKDITLERVSSLASKALVGKFFYIKMRKAQISQWIQDFWKPLVGYCLRYSLLSNHWLVFHFLVEEDLLKILDIP
jgi:hypothetical protein